MATNVASGRDVPTLEALPNPRNRRVLVRATLDQSLGGRHPTSMGHRRAEWLRSTLSWLVDRSARVTVCGDTRTADPGDGVEFTPIRDAIAALAPEVAIADDTSVGELSVEEGGVIERLVASNDLYVNDSFQWSYLPLPSLVLPPSRLPAAVGRTVEHDLAVMAGLLDGPERPFTAILGGDRCFLRLHGLEGLVLRADAVLIGGAMALPFLQATGHLASDASTDREFLSECRRLCGLAERVGHHIHLPGDLVWVRQDGRVDVSGPGEHPGGRVVDIGPRTAQTYAEMAEGSAALLWTGSLGQVEDERFRDGTRTVASALCTSAPIVGGDALMSILDGDGLLPKDASVLSATDSALELVKTGDLAALRAIRAGTKVA